MTPADLVRFAWRSLWFARVRSVLSLVAMAIGVAAVIVLTWLGEGARGYIASQFEELGAHLVIVLPGRNETVGGLPPILADIPRDLTVDDALALRRSPAVQLAAPLAFGTAPVQFENRIRECPVLGSTGEMLAIRHLTLAQGRFLEGVDPHRGAGVCIVGAGVKEELFGARSALGEIVRIGDRRFRLVGVLQPMGHSLGLDIDDCILVPVADALALFNSPSLFRILVQARGRQSIEACRADVERILAERHGEHDVTVITQDALMGTFDRIFVVLTLTVAGIAAISLVVAGILIMNVMTVSVAQRTGEVGLLVALGARRRDVAAAFLAEAALLSCLGALLGVGVGQLVTRLASGLYPALRSPAPGYAMAAAAGTALLAGLLFGVLPAWRAAKLDPVLALSRR